jgi:hypothetical protein
MLDACQCGKSDPCSAMLLSIVKSKLVIHTVESKGGSERPKHSAAAAVLDVKGRGNIRA